MVKSVAILTFAFALFFQCSADKINEETCKVISEPSQFVNERVKVRGIVIYDEFPMLFSENDCSKFDRKKSYISLSIDFSNDDLTSHIYKSRDASGKTTFGSVLFVEGVLRKRSNDNESYYFIEVQNYTKGDIHEF